MKLGKKFQIQKQPEQQPKTGNNDMVSKNYIIVLQLLCGALAMMLDFKS